MIDLVPSLLAAWVPLCVGVVVDERELGYGRRCDFFSLRCARTTNAALNIKNPGG